MEEELFYKEKTILITGGASGIGRALVQKFCELGATTVFCDIDGEKGSAVAAEFNAVFIKCDVGNQTELLDALETVGAVFGTIDIVINNAGISFFKPLLEMEIDEFSRVIDVNLKAMFTTSQFMAKQREERKLHRKYGSIINIASTRAFQSEEGGEAYAASKGGVISLTHALAISLSKFNITVNSISPGWINCDPNAQLSYDDHSQHPSGRVGNCADIVSAVLFLCDPKNNFINGENLIIDGGMTKKMIYC